MLSAICARTLTNNEEKEAAMGKQNRQREGAEQFGRCEICLELIPIEYYFHKGDIIACQECGTEYEIISKSPVKLLKQDGDLDDEDYQEMSFDD